MKRFALILSVVLVFSSFCIPVQADSIFPLSVPSRPSLGTAMIAAGSNFTAAVAVNGTVLNTVLTNNGSYDNPTVGISDWTDVVQISISPRPNSHITALKSDGTVVASGYNSTGACEVSSWTDIVKVASGTYTTIGLKSDGTVVSTPITKASFDYSQADVSGYTGIVDIAAGRYFTALLKSDGTVVLAYNDPSPTALRGRPDTSSWTNIVAISAGHYHLLGLKSDGTVVATGGNNSGGQLDVSAWSDIVQVTAGEVHSLGLKSDGTVLAVGSATTAGIATGTMNVSEWSDIIQVSAAEYSSVGLKSDGTLVATGYSDDGRARLDVGSWRLWYDEPQIYLLNQPSVTAGSTTHASFVVDNYTRNALDVEIVMGFYDEDGNLINNYPYFNKGSYGAGSYNTINSAYTVVPESAATVKWMVWSGDDSLRPLCDAVIVSIE